MYILDASVREELNPFVFFNSGTVRVNEEEFVVPMHPHSGIGIITYFDQGVLHHKNSSGIEAYIDGGGAQWINAGGGTFHEERHKKEEVVSKPWSLSMYQLWMPLPPDLEEGPVEYESYQPKDFPRVGNVKIIAGTYKGITSPLKSPYNMTYLDVELKADEVFELQTPRKQNSGFIYGIKGKATLAGEELSFVHLNILEKNEGNIRIHATESSRFLLIIGEPLPYPMLAHWGSIHTNEASMIRSMERIRRIQY